MRPDIKRAHYILAGVAFFVAFLTYLLTMQPTIPFWDCGEFAAAASALQVPHPPGAPLWTLVGRIAMLLPTFSDPAARYNLFSVLSSAASILLLYLTLVKLIKMWRGTPATTGDAIITLGGAFIGALAYCWTDSFWFNALECEVYAFGSLFISLVPWLLLIWEERADEPHNEKYLLLIAYVVGLSLGVHQLALLTLFPVFMIVYYRRRKTVTLPSWLGMVGLSVIAFAIIFKIILSNLVDWAGNGKAILSILSLAAIVGSVIYGHVKKKPRYALAGWVLVMVFLGYTTYMSVMVRAAQNPPMNENAPSSFAKLAGYINRDQYGQVNLADEIEHRRLPKTSGGYKETTWENYSSDGEFFWKYQTNFMFHRYLGWNFIGRDGDFQGAGVAFNKTLALPFILGLFGIYWHFKRDPKRALTLLGAFAILGYMVCWYQNQQDPQPRERDYFYVGAFYIFAMWIGVGAVGVMEWVKERYAAWDSRKLNLALGSSAGLLLLFGPINQCIGLTGMLQGMPFDKSSKWAEYSRKNNWVPFEYAYNILQSCDANAILFTWGDNDTFPLWCIQDAYGIRRDVRIVQLQLVTMMWNVAQIKKDNEWGAKAVKLTMFTDDLVKQSDNEVYSQLDWHQKAVNMPVDARTVRWITGDSAAQATTFNWQPQIVEPSDLVVLDIIKNNLDSRPIYYSSSVPENARAGLGKYLIYEGMAARVTPFEQPQDQTGMGGAVRRDKYAEAIFNVHASPQKQPSRGTILNSYADPNAHRSGLDDEYSANYRMEFMRLASWDVQHGVYDEARRALDTMEARIPLDKLGLDFSFTSFIADLADKCGNWPLMRKYAKYGAQKLNEQRGELEESGSNEFQLDYEQANLKMRAGNCAEAKKEFEALLSHTKQEQQPLIRLKMQEADACELESKKQYDSAYRIFTNLLNTYAPAGNISADLADLRAHQVFDSMRRQSSP